jgi:hypothetical protein
MRRTGRDFQKKRLFWVFSDTSQPVEIKLFFDKAAVLTYSRVAQSHEVFDILLGSH